MIVRKKLPAKSNRSVLNESENTYRLFSAEPGLALFSGTAKMSRHHGFRELLLAKQAVLLRLCIFWKKMTILAIHSNLCPVSIFCYSAVPDLNPKMQPELKTCLLP